MRKNVFIAIWLIASSLVLTSCHGEKENEIPGQNESDISLVAPNGQRIAEDMTSLEKEVSMMVAKQFGDDLKFNITSIEYAPVDKGYLALINYSLYDGRSSNFAKTNNTKVLTNSPADIVHYKRPMDNLRFEKTDDNAITLHGEVQTRSTNTGENYSFVCKSATNCKPCQVKIVSVKKDYLTDTEDGSTTKISCSDRCTDCKLEVTIQ